MTNEFITKARKYLSSLDAEALNRCVKAYNRFFSDPEDRITTTKRSAIILHILRTDPVFTAGGLYDFLEKFHRSEKRRAARGMN